MANDQLTAVIFGVVPESLAAVYHPVARFNLNPLRNQEASLITVQIPAHQTVWQGRNEEFF